MMKRFRYALCFLLLSLGVATLQARENASPKEPSLAEKQQALSGKYEQLESILLRMAEINASTDPRRAALLKKVIGESKNKLIPLRMEELIVILQRSRFTQAISTQEDLESDLKELLRLLESENRDKLRTEEKEKIKEFLKAIDELILQQRSLKGRTSGSEDAPPLSREQEKLGEKTTDLARDMSALDDSEESSKDGKEGTENSEQKSGSGEEQNQSPTQKSMNQAQKRMKRAKESLDQAEKKDALQEQEEAIAQLQKARAELERALRQMREEEMMQSLQFLDARLRKMLQLEKAIRVQTERVSQQQGEISESTPGSERQVQILAARLGVDQSKVLEEADAALFLLREDGTARAMSESLEQTRFDMLDLVQRLNRVELGKTTLQIEDSIIEAIQEMIDAVAQAKKESQDRQNQPQGNSESQMSEEEQNLIGLLSELRMIRTMQRRINERTRRYEEQLLEGQTDLSVLQKRVEELTRQQNKVQKILHEIQIGKNQ